LSGLAISCFFILFFCCAGRK